jgi:hypothetical protein
MLNNALSSLLIYLLDALGGICFCSKPLACGCERYPGFQVKEDKFLAWDSLLSGPTNKSYICIELSLLETYLILKLKTSYGLAD